MMYRVFAVSFLFLLVLVSVTALPGDFDLEDGTEGLYKHATRLDENTYLCVSTSRILNNGDVVFAYPMENDSTDKQVIRVQRMTSQCKIVWSVDLDGGERKYVHGIVLHGSLVSIQSEEMVASNGAYYSNYYANRIATLDLESGKVISSRTLTFPQGDGISRIHDSKHNWPLSLLCVRNKLKTHAQLGEDGKFVNQFDLEISSNAIHSDEKGFYFFEMNAAGSKATITGISVDEAGTVSKTQSITLNPTFETKPDELKTSIYALSSTNGVVYGAVYHSDEGDCLGVTLLQFNVADKTLTASKTFEITEDINDDKLSGLRDERRLLPVVLPDESVVILFEENKGSTNYSFKTADFESLDAAALCIDKAGAFRWSTVIDKKQRQSMAPVDIGLLTHVTPTTIQLYYRTKGSSEGFAGIDVNILDGSIFEREYYNLDVSRYMVFYKNTVFWPNDNTMMTLWRNGPTTDDAHVISIELDKVSKLEKAD